jgi:hypothetical protein
MIKMNSYNEIYTEDLLQDLPLIRVMKSVLDCPVMEYGLKKIPMDFYFCNCDKDHKYTICGVCMETCHKGHSPTDYVEKDENILATCMCGIKSHQILEESRDKHENNIKCHFHELSSLSQNYNYYESSGTVICTFCKLF